MSLKEALEVMRKCVKNSPFRFDIEFVTYDANRKKAGKLKQFKSCRLASSSHNEMDHGTITIMAAGMRHETTLHLKLIMKVNGEFVN